MSNKKAKGKAFEEKVGEILTELWRLHPSRVRFRTQPRFELYDAQEVKPDFELQFDLLFEESRYLIECQDRKRSSAQIAQKIRYMKALSSRNKFIFVHAAEIPMATQNALDADGVMRMTFKEFTLFIAKLELQLRQSTLADASRVADVHRSFSKHFSVSDLEEELFLDIKIC